MRTSGNTVLITGGSSGIGLALAKRFAAQGNKVIITGRDLQKLENTGIPGVVTFAGDLAERDSLDSLVLFIEQRYPDLNLLVNNAAIQYNYQFAEEPQLVAKISREIATNLTAPITLTGLLLPLLLKNDGSAVVLLGSGLFLSPKAAASVYCATKAAIHSLSKTLRYQLEPHGVRVFEIIPPLVETPMTEGRGGFKITADALVDEFFRDFTRNKPESYIGKTKLLRLIHRLYPTLADRMMRNGV